MVQRRKQLESNDSGSNESAEEPVESRERESIEDYVECDNIESTSGCRGDDPGKSDSSCTSSSFSCSSSPVSDSSSENHSDSEQGNSESSYSDSDSSDSDSNHEDNSKDSLNRLFQTTINATVNMTIKDIMLLIYVFSIRHNLDWQTVESLTILIKTIIGDVAIPQSKYYFKKLFCNEKETIPIVHFNCHNCKKYLGTENDLKQGESNAVCEVCGTEVNLNRKYRNRNLFISIPLKPQLRRHIEDAVASNELHFQTEVVNQQHNEAMTDIFDGELYRNLVLQNQDQKFITLTLNTDGARVFRTATKSSVWPLQFYVNEIEQNKRFQRSNLLISSIAFGNAPDMGTFLRPFLEEINKLNADGGMPVKMNGHITKVLIIPHLWTLDSVAKCDVLNKVQFNGYNGCPYCFHPGTKVGRNDIRYSNANNAADRNDADTRNAMREAHLIGARVRGYKGLSPLIVLPNFDIIWQVVIDKMHNVDLGVVKKLFELFLKSSKEM